MIVKSHNSLTMKLLAFVFLLHVASLSAQIMILPNDPNFSKLTKEERDSLQRGLMPKNLEATFKANVKRQRLQQDSVLKTVIGSPIRDFDAPDTEGIVHRPSAYRGRVWLVHCWHFWDYSLQNEIPYLNMLADSLRSDGVEVLSFVDVPMGNDEKTRLAATPLHFPLIPNARRFADELLGFYFRKPFVLIVDRQGIVRYFYDEEVIHGARFKDGNHRNELLDPPSSAPPFDFLEKIRVLLRE